MTNDGALRRELTSRIERLIVTRVESYRHVEGGYTPALRLLCSTAKGSFFVKVGATPLTSEFLRREIHVYKQVRGEFIPNLVAWEDHETEPVLITEDLSAHHWPPPWTERQVELALAQISAMHDTKASLESFAEVHGEKSLNWQTVAADSRAFLLLGIANEQWLEAALPILLKYEARCATAGSNLCHIDLRSDNMCITKTRAVFVDWNLACLSNSKLDLGCWLPSLAYEGGPQPEKILPDAPEVAAWVSGFFCSTRRLASN